MHDCQVIAAEYATEDQLLSVHSPEYIARLRSLGNEPLSLSEAATLMSSGEKGAPFVEFNSRMASQLEFKINDIDPSDNPHTKFTPNVAALAAGGSCIAIDAVCQGALTPTAVPLACRRLAGADS